MMKFDQVIQDVESQAKDLVWWSPSQIANGHTLENDPQGGERAWIIPRTTGEFLHTLVVEKKPQTILELGTSIGYSTLWLAHGAPQAILHTIERNKEKVEIAKENLKKAGLDNIVFHEGLIQNFLQELPEDLFFDFVFLDADRGHYHEYWPLIKKHLSKNAMVVADNAVNMQQRMSRFLTLLDNEKILYKIKNLDNGLLIIDLVQYYNS